ncbi:hypothetical protein GCM10010969_27460 [Saccharibacillus kuerlensis]|uniref:Uncharacterized protein n=2 Tax=Saccharibacillus kuerlensis TaxID=459527 RepID=A0ABQ2L6Y9_9BACL|nr:hypothetical protein GCM10010969_27460 [Saccharibacillus kuerlensis]
MRERMLLIGAAAAVLILAVLIGVRLFEGSELKRVPDNEVNITAEKAQAAEVLTIGSGLEAESVVDSFDADVLVEILDPQHFVEFVPDGAKIGEVTRTNSSAISIDYREGSHRTIVSYYGDGKVRKTTTVGDYIQDNLNDESRETIDIGE